MTPPTPHDCLRRAIARWEGLYSNDPADAGNWLAGRLIGTMRGVTAAAYAAYTGRPAAEITANELRTAVTLDLAADIGLRSYYQAYRLDRLPWGAPVEIALDAVWMSGAEGVRLLQRLVQADPDGEIGPVTVAAYSAYLAAHPIADVVEALTELRVAYLQSISRPGTRDAKFQAGWLRRAEWYRPSNAAWWSLWEPDAPAAA